MDRKLDGCFFRVKREDGYCNVCFSDLTPKERDELFEGKDRPAEWWKSLAYHLGDRLKLIGDELDLELVDRDDTD